MNLPDEILAGLDRHTAANTHSPHAIYLLAIAQLPVQFTGPAISIANVLQLAQAHLQQLQELQIETVRVGTLLACYKLIPRDQFEGDQATQNLADLNWLTPRVLAHEGLVSKLASMLPVYPARFGCLFSSTEALCNLLRAQRAILSEYFARIGTRREWGVKMVVNLDSLGESLAKAELAAHAGPGIGVNYLRLKQLERKYRAQALQSCEEYCQSAIAHLGTYFPDLVIRSTAHITSPDRQRVLANLAVLVSDESTDQLQRWQPTSEVHPELSGHIRVQLSGPWPPYSFCPSLPNAA